MRYQDSVKCILDIHPQQFLVKKILIRSRDLENFKTYANPISTAPPSREACKFFHVFV